MEKFLFALENISASVEEILFLARGFQYDTDSELRKEIIDVLDPKNIAPLEFVSQGVSKECPFSKQTETYFKCHSYQVLYEEHGRKGRVNGRGSKSPS